MMKRTISTLLLATIFLSLLLPITASARDELKNTDPTKYYILLDLRNQFVTVFEKDAQGEYTKVVRRMICTTGRTNVNSDDPEDVATPTPRGVYKIGGRERFGEFAAFRATYARYWTQIVGGVYFHSIMFSKRDLNTLQSSAYNGLGRNMSHGCVRLYVEDAKWLYYYAPPGTTINVSTTEPANRALTKQLKYAMSFKEYDAFQKTIYDEPELPNFMGYVTYDGAQVRSGNGTADKALFKLPEGVEVEMLQIGDAWHKIKYNDREGYVKSAFISLEQGKVTGKADADVIRSTVYMSVSPDKSADVIVKIPRDTSVKVLEPAENGWVKVQYYNEVGYVPSSSVIKGWGTIRD